MLPSGVTRVVCTQRCYTGGVYPAVQQEGCYPAVQQEGCYPAVYGTVVYPAVYGTVVYPAVLQGGMLPSGVTRRDVTQRCTGQVVYTQRCTGQVVYPAVYGRLTLPSGVREVNVTQWCTGWVPPAPAGVQGGYLLLLLMYRENIPLPHLG